MLETCYDRILCVTVCVGHCYWAVAENCWFCEACGLILTLNLTLNEQVF